MDRRQDQPDSQHQPDDRQRYRRCVCHRSLSLAQQLRFGGPTVLCHTTINYPSEPGPSEKQCECVTGHNRCLFTVEGVFRGGRVDARVEVEVRRPPRVDTAVGWTRMLTPRGNYLIAPQAKRSIGIVWAPYREGSTPGSRFGGRLPFSAQRIPRKQARLPPRRHPRRECLSTSTGHRCC